MLSERSSDASSPRAPADREEVADRDITACATAEKGALSDAIIESSGSFGEDTAVISRSNDDFEFEEKDEANTGCTERSTR